MNRKGFTLIEMLSVVVILSILMALLFPIFPQMMHATEAVSSTSNLHQLYLGASLYRTDNDGDGIYGPAGAMGLPDMVQFVQQRPDTIFPGTTGLWASPCGQHPDSASLAAIGTDLDYHASNDPTESWTDYVMRQQDSAVLFYDLNCSDHDIPLDAEYFPKTVIGVRLDGSGFRLRKTGMFVDLNNWDR